MLVKYMGGIPNLEHKKRDKICSKAGCQRNHDQRLPEKGQHQPDRHTRKRRDQVPRGRKHRGNRHGSQNGGERKRTAKSSPIHSVCFVQRKAADLCSLYRGIFSTKPVSGNCFALLGRGGCGNPCFAFFSGKAVINRNRFCWSFRPTVCRQCKTL